MNIEPIEKNKRRLSRPFFFINKEDKAYPTREGIRKNKGNTKKDVNIEDS
ncbi:MAG: hypothetical protein NTY22_07115 [Proteobacteria bacterium]|nr:hypothetical protein [Pseudomonadota bacterium]